MRILGLVFCLALLATPSAAAVSNSDAIVKAITPEELVTLLAEVDVKASVEEKGEKIVRIFGTYAEKYPLFFVLSDCGAQGCTVINSYIIFGGPPAQMEFVNWLNNVLLIGKNALLKDGKSFLDIFTVFDSGITRQQLADQVPIILGLVSAYVEVRKKWEKEKSGSDGGIATLPFGMGSGSPMLPSVDDLIERGRSPKLPNVRDGVYLFGG